MNFLKLDVVELRTRHRVRYKLALTKV